MSWKLTEQSCINYIKNIVPENIVVKECGGADSTVPDIELYKGGKNLFNIEVKESCAQAGQFVVLKKKGLYEFSDSIVDSINCKPILDYINSNIGIFNNPTSKGIIINCAPQLMYKRVIQLYLSHKNSPFFITNDNGNFLIFKTKDLPSYFDISCVLRLKKSGSNDISKKNIDLVKKTMLNYFAELKLDVSFEYKGKKMYIVIDSNKDFSKETIRTDSFDIFISKSSTNKYVLRQLSKTNNPNVIFTLSLKQNHPNTQESIFLELLSK